MSGASGYVATNLVGERAVGPGLGRGRHDDGETEGLARGCVREHGGAVGRVVEVPREAEETLLHVGYEEDLGHAQSVCVPSTEHWGGGG